MKGWWTYRVHHRRLVRNNFSIWRLLFSRIASRSTKMFPFLLKRHICFLWLVFWVPNKRCFEMKGCGTWLTSPSSSICAKQFLDFEVPAFEIASRSFNEDVSISLETATFECKMWQVLYIFSPKTFSRMKFDRHI